MVYGLDVHKHFIQVCALSADGKHCKDLRIGASREEVEAFARTLRRWPATAPVTSKLRGPNPARVGLSSPPGR